MSPTIQEIKYKQLKIYSNLFVALQYVTISHSGDTYLSRSGLATSSAMLGLLKTKLGEQLGPQPYLGQEAPLTPSRPPFSKIFKKSRPPLHFRSLRKILKADFGGTFSPKKDYFFAPSLTHGAP